MTKEILQLLLQYSKTCALVSLYASEGNTEEVIKATVQAELIEEKLNELV